MGVPKPIYLLDAPIRLLQLTDLFPVRDPVAINGPAHKYTIQELATLIGGGGGGLSTASNGLSTPDGIDVQLGTLDGGLGTPFQDDRKIDFNGFAFHGVNPHYSYDTFDSLSPVDTYTDFPTGYLLRATMNNSVSVIPWEEFLDNNTAGFPPTNDLIHISGWNIDSRFLGSQPSWTDRIEYQYTGSLYERHLQWSDAGAVRTYRFISTTFTDHGSDTADLCLIFLTANDMEFRPVYGNTGANMFALHYAGPTDSSQLELRNLAGTFRMIIEADTVSGNMSISDQSIAGGVPLMFPRWGSINMGSQVPGGANCSFENGTAWISDFVPTSLTGGNEFGFFSTGNDLRFDWLQNIPKWHTLISNNTGEWSDNWQGTADYFRTFVAGAVTTLFLNITNAIFGVPMTVLSLTTTQKNALVVGAGTIIRDSTLNKLCYYNGATWETVTSV